MKRKIMNITVLIFIFIFISSVLIGCNQDQRYTVIDYEIVYDVIVARVETNHNIVETYMFEPSNIVDNKEGNYMKVMYGEKYLFLIHDEFIEYKKILFNKD